MGVIPDNFIDIVAEDGKDHLIITAKVEIKLEIKIPYKDLEEMQKLPGGIHARARRDLRSFVKRIAEDILE